ncbi:serpin peptidase inhibitor, clade F (alpha-2 antiplasmin, pigment epithelium derived factor), member 2b [Narcine bancroftii]|uniref:serpin peptidase inhibitor, clade F (alpha-2 antiplasmin, pigment epithelium derived factor), member 2b n=1 Tax=Narcine bancroftii TaxID=1343680 RepID=UPI0038318F27
MKTWTFVAILLCLFKPTLTTHGKDALVCQNTADSANPEAKKGAVVDEPRVTSAPNTSQGPGGTYQPDVAPSDSKVMLVEPEGGQEEQCSGPTPPASLQLLGKAIANFGIDTFKKVLTETKRPNVVISPLSIVLGLAQLALGSANRTERELLRALHFDPLHCSHDALHTAVNSFSHTVLCVASTLYIQQGFHLKPGFLKEMEQFYKSIPQTLSGVSANDTRKVNSWVEKMTGGKIKTFLKNVPGNIDLLLVNAVNFKGLWQVQFDPRATISEPFYLQDGSLVHIPMMQHPKYPVSIFHHEELQSEVIKMTFKQNISFIVVKPMVNQKLDAVVSRVNISDILRYVKARPMMVKLPKLNFNFGLDLKVALRSLGLDSLFMSPDLSRMSSRPLAVSAVYHKATMEVTEEGVEAAASTGVVINRSLLQCIINRPFFFLIQDDRLGIPLFLGTVKDPQPGLRKEWKEKMTLDQMMEVGKPSPK